jgi:hypothetical protein
LNNVRTVFGFGIEGRMSTEKTERGRGGGEEETDREREREMDRGCEECKRDKRGREQENRSDMGMEESIRRVVTKRGALAVVGLTCRGCIQLARCQI